VKLDFDAGLNPAEPLNARRAVQRGSLLINGPVSVIMAAGFLTGALVFGNSPLALVPGAAGFVAAWLWWSYATPRWRRWALRRGVDPEQLQRLAEFKLVWPKGWFLEKTEFRIPDDEG
jgi:hypothetical protein